MVSFLFLSFGRPSPSLLLPPRSSFFLVVLLYLVIRYIAADEKKTPLYAKMSDFATLFLTLPSPVHKVLCAFIASASSTEIRALLIAAFVERRCVELTRLYVLNLASPLRILWRWSLRPQKKDVIPDRAFLQLVEANRWLYVRFHDSTPCTELIEACRMTKGYVLGHLANK